MSNAERAYKHFFEDIIGAISKIDSYLANVSYDTFCQRPMIVDAVVRNFEIIGEAANKIPVDIREKYPKVEWRQAINFRNILIHNYFEIDVETVWDTVHKNIPSLKKHIMQAYEEVTGEK